MTTPDPATLREALAVPVNYLQEGGWAYAALAEAARWALDLIEGGKAKLPCEHSRYDRHPDPNSVIGNFCPGGMLVTP